MRTSSYLNDSRKKYRKARFSALLQAGFKRAFVTIFDANMTVIITSAILFFLGSATVKGFALTLGLGVAVSMFTAITVSRTLLMLLIDANWIHNPWWFGGERGYDR